MNTDTPLTDALSDSYPGHDEKDARLLKHARRLELALAKANADKAELVGALKYALTYGTFGSAVDNPLHARALDNARAALSQVQA